MTQSTSWSGICMLRVGEGPCTVRDQAASAGGPSSAIVSAAAVAGCDRDAGQGTKDRTAVAL